MNIGTSRFFWIKAPFFHLAAIAPIGRIAPGDDMTLHVNGRKGTVAGGQTMNVRQPEGSKFGKVGLCEVAKVFPRVKLTWPMTSWKITIFFNRKYQEIPSSFMLGFPLTEGGTLGGVDQPSWHVGWSFQRLFYLPFMGFRTYPSPLHQKKTSRHHCFCEANEGDHGPTAWNWWYYYSPPNNQLLKHLEKIIPKKEKGKHHLPKKSTQPFTFFLVHGWAPKPQKKIACWF